MNEVVYNYAVVRFTPYPETGEFVNCGVIMTCASRGFLAAKFSRARNRRVSDFFQELDKRVYPAVLTSFRKEVTHACGALQKVGAEQAEALALDASEAALRFQVLTRPREGMIRVSDVCCGILPADTTPQRLLEIVYQDQVERQFARTSHYWEQEMVGRIRATFSEHNLAGVYEERRIGTDEFGVRLPFVHVDVNNRPTHAIKPLDLDQKDTTAIYERGDAWLNRIRRMRCLGAEVPTLLFPVNFPATSAKKRNAAARRICNELQEAQIQVAQQDQADEILAFAKSAV